MGEMEEHNKAREAGEGDRSLTHDTTHGPRKLPDKLVKRGGDGDAGQSSTSTFRGGARLSQEGDDAAPQFAGAREPEVWPGAAGPMWMPDGMPFGSSGADDKHPIRDVHGEPMTAWSPMSI